MQGQIGFNVRASIIVFCSLPVVLITNHNQPISRLEYLLVSYVCPYMSRTLNVNVCWVDFTCVLLFRFVSSVQVDLKGLVELSIKVSMDITNKFTRMQSSVCSFVVWDILNTKVTSLWSSRHISQSEKERDREKEHKPRPCCLSS